MRLRSLAVLAAMVVLVQGCSTPSVNAGLPPYDPTALTGGAIYHWPAGMTISIHVMPGPVGSDGRLETEVRTASRQWMDALGYREHVLRLVDDAAAADIIVHDARTASPVDTECAGTGWSDAAATALFCPLGDTARTLPLLDGRSGRTKLLITVDVIESDSYASGLPPIVLHELGHALGIGGHSSITTDVMFAFPGVRSPSRRDALTLRYVLQRRPDLTI